MPLSPALLIFGVQGLVKLGQASVVAYEQYQRDKPIMLPSIRVADVLPLVLASDFFQDHEKFRTKEPLRTAWADLDPEDIRLTKDSSQKLVAAWMKLDPSAAYEDMDIAVTVAQWPKEDGPPPPYMHLLKAMTEVALDFASVAPGVVRTGASGHKVLSAVAEVASKIILPDLDDPDEWKQNYSINVFGQTLVVAAFRAGLGTLADKPDLVVSNKALAGILAGVVQPLQTKFIEAFEGNKSTLTWELVRDNWLPAMVAGGLNAVVANRQILFRDVLSPEMDDSPASKTIAMVAKTIFEKIETLKLGDARDLFLRENLMSFWQAAMGAIAAHPDLLFETDDVRVRKASQALLSKVFARLADTQRIDRGLVLALAAATLEGAREAIPALTTNANDWVEALGDLADNVVSGIEVSLGTKQSNLLLKRLGSTENLTRMLQLLLTRIAATPRMVIGKKAQPELKAVVAAIATAMKSEGADLLTAQGWLVVAGAAADAAARDPARLFRFDAEGVLGGPGAALLKIVLRTAHDQFQAAAPLGRPILLGPLLQDVIEAALRDVADHIRDEATDSERLGRALCRIADAAVDDNRRLQPREIARVFSRAAVGIIEGSLAPDAPMEEFINA